MRSSPERGSNLALRSNSSVRPLSDSELGLPVTDREDSPPRITKFANRRQRLARLLRYAAAGAFILLLGYSVYALDISSKRSSFAQTVSQGAGFVLVSYSYFEKDDVQRANAEFFFKAGLGLGSGSAFLAPKRTDFIMVVQGKLCNPCEKLQPKLAPDALVHSFPTTLASAWSGKGITLLWRLENEGMDFAAHNASMEWMSRKEQLKKYRYFIFLNSSVKGPFFPSYMPSGWQWTRAFTDRLSASVKAVASSLVCLPHEDAGGYGPKLESWAFALDAEGLKLTTAAGVFRLRTCKLCADDDGIVVRGEYGLSQALLSAGYNIATLLSRYSRDVDWRERKHWDCNDNVHPSRHGTYDGISMHPFETVFLKASWHVGQPHLDAYTRWFGAHSEGKQGTAGAFNSSMYRYAISEAAQQPNKAGDCFKVLDG